MSLRCIHLRIQSFYQLLTPPLLTNHHGATWHLWTTFVLHKVVSLDICKCFSDLHEVSSAEEDGKKYWHQDDGRRTTDDGRRTTDENGRQYHLESLRVKALFNNVSTLKKSELHGLYIVFFLFIVHAISLCDKVYKLGPEEKKLHFNSFIECFNEVKIDKWQVIYHTHPPPPPIDCCVLINHIKSDGLLNGDIQS